MAESETPIRIERVDFVIPKPGQKPKYTPQRVKKICEYISKGLPKRHAAAAVGINEKTYYGWLKRYPEFEEAIAVAEAEMMDYHLRVIDGKQDAAVSLKLLKSRFPEHFSEGERRVKVSGEVEHLYPQLEEGLRNYREAFGTGHAERTPLDAGGSPAALPPAVGGGGAIIEIDDTGQPVCPNTADAETGEVPGTP